MLIIGLTGGIGSGKSTAANFFRDKHIDVIDLDQLARQVVEPGTPALEKISQRFGETILLKDGALNRKKLGEIIFNDKQQKAWLESLLHPLIHQEKERAIEKSRSPYVIIEIPLLTENRRQGDVDRVLVINTDREKQIQRASSRDSLPKEQIEKIIGAQATADQRKAVADDLVDNNGPESELGQKLDLLHQQYLQLANQTCC